MPAAPRRNLPAAEAGDLIGPCGGSQAHAAIETVIRLESSRLIAGLARYAYGDIGIAEELAQDAVVAALEQWPGQGVPANPGAWLMTVAKRRAVDQFRRNRELERKYAQIGRVLEAEARRRHGRPGPRGRRRHRRRPAAADLHLLPPGAAGARPGSR